MLIFAIIVVAILVLMVLVNAPITTHLILGGFSRKVNDDRKIDKEVEIAISALGSQQEYHPVTLNNIDGRIPYKSGVMLKPTVHMGYLKLLLSEIQFLTRSLQDTNTRALVVYAGAAPSNKAYILHEMFPTVSFLLIDIAKFNILGVKDKSIIQHCNTVHDVGDSNKRIFLLKALMTIDLCQEIKEVSKKFDQLFFWSDIRTRSGDEEPGDKDIVLNLAQQANWVHVFGSGVKYMLKFRLPFRNEIFSDTYTTSDDFAKYKELFGENIIDSYNHAKVSNIFRYLPGDIYLQAFSGSNSTETRLVGQYSGKLFSYDCIEYDEKLYYYNNVERPFKLFKNLRVDIENGIDMCGDCALEATILDEYEKWSTSVGGKGKIKDIFGKKWIDVLYSINKKRRDKNGHGRLLKKPSPDDVDKMRAKTGKYN